MQLLEDAGWTWVTSASATGGVLVATATGGYFILSDPKGGQHRFNYGTVGGSVGKTIGPVSLSVSTSSNFSTGNLYYTTASHRPLWDEDIEGFCLSIDGSAGGGDTMYSGSIMLMGIPPALMNSQLDSISRAALMGPIANYVAGKFINWLADDPSAAKRFFQTYARSVMLMGGQGAGWLSMGVGASIGYVSGTAVIPDLSGIKTSSEGSGSQSSSTSKIVLPNDILFDFDKSIIKPDAMIYLTRLLGARTGKPKAIIVYGHTDDVGSSSYNFVLSGQRASAVAAFMIACGYSPGTITTKPMGETQPIDTNATEEGRSKNRRVEIEFL